MSFQGSTGSNAGYGQRNTQQHAASNQYINSDGPNNILDSYNQGVNELNEEEDNQPPCLNCSLIQQGSAISYGDNSCPQCGRDVGMQLISFLKYNHQMVKRMASFFREMRLINSFFYVMSSNQCSDLFMR